MRTSLRLLSGVVAGLVILTIVSYDGLTIRFSFIIGGLVVTAALGFGATIVERYSGLMAWSIVGLGVPLCGVYVGGQYGTAAVYSFLAGACFGYTGGVVVRDSIQTEA